MPFSASLHRCAPYFAGDGRMILETAVDRFSHVQSIDEQPNLLANYRHPFGDSATGRIARF